MPTRAPKLTLVLLATLIGGCQVAAGGALPGGQAGPTPAGCAETPARAENPAEPVVVAFSSGPYKDWGAVIADAACDGRPVRFEGSGYEGSKHVAFWLQGAGQSFFPGRVENGRVPGAVLLGASDVVDGRVTFVRRFAPAIGPTADCGTMTLTPGARYGWVVVSDHAFSSYVAIEIPARPCLAAEVPASLRVAPLPVCPGATTTITGEGFTPGPVVLQVWKHYVPAPGEFYSGKAPPEEREIGVVTADAAGRIAFEWKAEVEPGRGRYVLRALDRGRTRLTTLDLDVCQP